MASSENQGLQIALIIFVMLTIILSVTTFVFFRSYEDADLRARADSDKATKADTAARAIQDEANTLKKMMGVGEQAKLPEIQASFAEDIKSYMAGIADEKKFYRQALE